VALQIILFRKAAERCRLYLCSVWVYSQTHLDPATAVLTRLFPEWTYFRLSRDISAPPDQAIEVRWDET
jgi:hypothetical protein